MRAYWNTGFLRDTPPRPPRQSEMDYQLRNPYHFLWLNGDYFVDALMHYLDLCNWAKGENPVEAQGQGGRSLCQPMQSGDTFDHHAVEFTFYANGTKMYAQTRQMPGCWCYISATVQGPEGSADISFGQIDGKHAWRFRGHMPNPYQVEHDLLIKAIRKGTPYNEVEYGGASTVDRDHGTHGQLLRGNHPLG